MILTLVRLTPKKQGGAGAKGKSGTLGASADSPSRAPSEPSRQQAAHPVPGEDELEVLCRSLRIISARDMDGTVTVVFRSILVEGPDRPVGSSELAASSRLNRVTVIHHLRRLERLGLVEHTQRKYRLRASGLSELVERMRAEMMESFERATEMAEDLDRQFLLMHAREEDSSFDSDALPHTPLLQQPAGKSASNKRKNSR